MGNCGLGPGFADRKRDGERLAGSGNSPNHILAYMRLPLTFL